MKGQTSNMHQINLNLMQMSIYVKSHDICKNFIKHDNMNYDVMIYALKVVRNNEFSGQVCMLSYPPTQIFASPLAITKP